MAKELRHAAVVAGQITENEYEAIGEHIIDGQANGDIVYASSAVQLSGLPIGATGQVLYVSGGAPAWFDGLTFANDGTVTTILGKTGDYIRIGDAGTTGHGLALEDDLLVTGKLEVDGTIYIDGQLQIFGTQVFRDDILAIFGTGGDAVILYETADANALALVFGLPHVTEDANNVPVAVFGDKDVVNVNLGFFNGITEPRIAVVDADRNSWMAIGFSADNAPAIFGGGGTATLLDIIPDSNNASYYFRLSDADNVPTIRGVGAYLRIGDAGTTGRGLASEDDLMVTGKLEVDGVAYFDNETTIEHSGLAFTVNRNSNLTNVMATSMKVKHTTSGVMAAGFAAGVLFVIRDDSAVDNNAGVIGFEREDADNTTGFTLRTYVTGATNTAMTVSSAGGLGVDANISTGDDPVALFDKYDDALVLKRGVQQRNHELLADIGVFTRKDTGSGYMMNIQPMTRLLAGGIYQNRALIDTVGLRIERLESELAALRASLN